MDNRRELTLQERVDVWQELHHYNHIQKCRSVVPPESIDVYPPGLNLEEKLQFLKAKYIKCPGSEDTNV